MCRQKILVFSFSVILSFFFIFKLSVLGEEIKDSPYIISASTYSLSPLPVEFGKKEEVPVTFYDLVVLPYNSSDSIEIEELLPDYVTAPFEAHTVIGSLCIYYNDRLYAEIPVYTEKSCTSSSYSKVFSKLFTAFCIGKGSMYYN